MSAGRHSRDRNRPAANLELSMESSFRASVITEGKYRVVSRLRVYRRCHDVWKQGRAM